MYVIYIFPHLVTWGAAFRTTLWMNDLFKSLNVARVYYQELEDNRWSLGSWDIELVELFL